MTRRSKRGGAPGLPSWSNRSATSARSRSVRLVFLPLAEVALRHEDELVLMVMDQAGWHLAGEPVVPENMRLLFLPPCSPELNPAEHLWQALREECFANHVFAGLDAVVQALAAGLRSLEADPSLTQSMTGFQWTTSTCLNATQHESALNISKARMQAGDWGSTCAWCLAPCSARASNAASFGINRA